MSESSPGSIAKKILVIEDAYSLRKDIIEMLGFEGFDVIGAENGLLGVEIAKRVIPDLIICDIMMPSLDGYGVLELLRQHPSTATIPFIFLTALTDRSDMRTGMELGADDYLSKPFSAVELLTTVQSRLKRHQHYDKMMARRMDDLRGNIILALPHELRTPLNVILGFTDLLATDVYSLDPKRIAEMIEHIKTAGLRLYRLIENFLIYTHTEVMISDPSQAVRLRSGYTYYPHQSLQNYARVHLEEIQRAGDLQAEFEPVEGVNIAEEYLKKLIEELVDNAAKFSSAGKPIIIRGEVQGDMYLVSVEDSGRGIGANQLNNLGAYMQFERRIYEQQGAGLGLIICKRLVELTGGQLSIESQEGIGTKVYLHLPIRTLTNE